MALTGYVKGLLDPTGVSTKDVKPISEGQKVNFVPDQPKTGGSIWSALDQVGTSVLNGVSQSANSIVQDQINSLVNGPEAKQDRTGDPYDNPGRVEQSPEPFTQRYRRELLLGGAAVAGLLIFMAVRG